MSRNFELLAEIERERDPDFKNEHVHAIPGRPDVKYAVMDEFPAKAEDAAHQQILGMVNNVFLSGKKDAPRSVLFLGVDEESGSSSVCARAGQALAQSSAKSVCLVDANLHSARLSRNFGVEKPIALPGKRDSAREQCKQLSGNLWLAGPDHITDVRGSLLPVEELKFRLDQLQDEFEYLLIDGPGTRSSKNTEFLARFADAAILVIEADKTRRPRAAKAIEDLDAAGVRVLGSVLNNRSFPIPEKLYKML